jgi:iron complex outermembrane receptor protein
MKRIAVTISGLLFLHFCNAQYIFKGRVIDTAGVPIPYVSVVIENQRAGTITNQAGDFILRSSKPSARVSFSFAGYQPVSGRLSAGDSIVIVLVPGEPAMGDVTVRAFENNAAAKNVPAAVTVLNKASLERYGNVSLVPALNTVPGVKMDERSPGSYRLSVRGNLLRSTFGVRNVKVYWDGIPFTDANGNTYLNQLAFDNVGKIEILKGPSGSMYGAGTGGVVLLSSAVPPLNTRQLSVQTAFGSYGLFNMNAAYNARSDKEHSGFSYTHQQSDGYRQQTGMRRDVAHYSTEFLAGPRHTISANIFYSDLYYQTPGALTPAEQAADPRQARPAAGMFRGAVAQQAALYLKTAYAGFSSEYRFSSRWSNSTGLYISHTNFKNPTIRNYERKTEQGAGGRTVFKFAGDKITGAFGGEYQYGFTNTATYGNRQGAVDTLQYHDEIDSRQYNIFLQVGWKVAGSFSVNAGLSYNNYHYGFLRVSDPGSKKESSDFSPQLVPRIALLQAVGANTNLYASVSKGYSPPSIDEVHASDGRFNKMLRAETGYNYEAGIKSALLHNKVWVDAAYYFFRLRNTIVSRRDVSGADYYVNAGKTKQQGLEIGVNYIPINKEAGFLRLVKIWGAYTAIHARFSEYQQGPDKFNGNKVTGIPPSVLAAGVDMHTGAGLFGNFSYTYTGSIPLNDANTFFATRYNLLFAKAGYRTPPGKKISAELYIAFEKSFHTPYSLGNDLNAAGNRFYNPSAPQQFTVGAKLTVGVE